MSHPAPMPFASLLPSSPGELTNDTARLMINSAQFRALPIPRQRDILRAKLPSFARLPPAVQLAVINTYMRTPIAKPAPMPSDAGIERGALSLLPAAGGIAGSLIGGTGGTVFGMGVGAVPGAIAGSALGAGGGEALRQLLSRALGLPAPTTSGDAAKDIGVQSAVSGASEAGAQALPLAAAPLRRWAEEQYAQFLYPTKRTTKELTERIVSDLLERPKQAIQLSQRGLAREAERQAERSGERISAATEALPATVRPKPYRVIQALNRYKNEFKVGKVAANRQAIAAADSLQQTVRDLGATVSYQSLNRLRQIWDKDVARAGGFAGVDISGRIMLDAKKAGADAIRSELAKASPDIAKLKAEYTFWSRVQEIIEDTVKRSTGQQHTVANLARTGLGSFGIFELARGNKEEGSILIALAGLEAATKSPLWRTTSAVTKNAIANAIASHNGRLALRLVAHIVAGAASRPTPAKGSQ